HELGRGLLTHRRQFRAAIETRARWRTASSTRATTTATTLARLHRFQLAERHDPPARATRISHHDLFRRPVTRDIRLATGTTRVARLDRDGQGTAHFLHGSAGRLHILTVAVHVTAVLEADGV